MSHLSNEKLNQFRGKAIMLQTEFKLGIFMTVAQLLAFECNLNICYICQKLYCESHHSQCQKEYL